jgi:hypothetical protein
MNRTPPGKDVKNVLATSTPEVRNLALAARTFVLETVPDVIEMVGVRARIIGYGCSPRYADQVCMLMPTKVGVNLVSRMPCGCPTPRRFLKERASYIATSSLRANRTWRLPL